MKRVRRNMQKKTFNGTLHTHKLDGYLCGLLREILIFKLFTKDKKSEVALPELSIVLHQFHLLHFLKHLKYLSSRLYFNTSLSFYKKKIDSPSATYLKAQHIGIPCLLLTCCIGMKLGRNSQSAWLR